MKPRLLDLFSGIGGFSLGLQRAGFEVAGQCELDPFCRAVLAKHWPHVWRHDDVTTLTGELVREYCGRIDIIAGGFPCQDISSAGKGAGLAGARSGLWSHMLRVIREVRPRWAVIENVPALRSRGADAVLAGLETAEYTTRAVVVGAWSVGAPHKRDRAWIVADCRSGAGDSGAERTGRSAGSDVDRGGTWAGVGNAGGSRGRFREPRRLTEGGEVFARTGEGMADAERGAGGRQGGKGPATELLRDGHEKRRKQSADRLEGPSNHGNMANTERHGLRSCGGTDAIKFNESCDRTVWAWPNGPGQEQHPWEAPRLVKFPLGGIVDGVPVRLVRFANRNALKAYGNALLPQIPELIGRWLIDSSKPNPPRR